MRDHVIVVPADNIIIVDGIGLRFDYIKPKNVHAIQWHNGKGHVEFADGSPNADVADYITQVLPYVELWEAEKKRLEEEQARIEAEELERYNSEEARFERLRSERNARIAATDFYLLADYPITEEQKEVLSAYRQALRDLPSQEGAPWDGGGELTPWPAFPDILQ